MAYFPLTSTLYGSSENLPLQFRTEAERLAKAPHALSNMESALKYMVRPAVTMPPNKPGHKFASSAVYQPGAKALADASLREGLA
mmetsp:Transcript_4890/g.7879  ORF Transcript_4890/g.7879 Transcript_4890/m.7879 type:complete len:85 (-) Transcript_4890:519-773(-)